MDQIYRAFQQADVVVMASPLYFWTVSGQLRCAVDRLCALSEGEHPTLRGGKEAVLLMAAAGEDFAPALAYHQSLLGFLDWSDRGHVLAGGVRQLGEIQGHPALEQARELGAAL